jgi:hypothetical protein
MTRFFIYVNRLFKMSLSLIQSKLTRAEWDNIEIPVSPEEREILQLIIDGYVNPNIRYNKKTSMFSFTKIDLTDQNEFYLHNKYFAPIIAKTIEKYPIVGLPFPDITSGNSISGGGPIKKIKSTDQIRFQNLEDNIEKNRQHIFEFLLLDFCNMMCRYMKKGDSAYSYYLYTLIHLKKASIDKINSYVTKYVDTIVEYGNAKTSLRHVISNAYEFIERNPYLLKNADRELYSHQKELFSIFSSSSKKREEGQNTSNLVLYISPTGTGKTMSPIGLTTEYRVIFVCAARHIGLALAKMAISMEKKIAIAFGCETASDIRLHYFAAVDYTRDRRSGGIRKVDNSNGSKVEMIICDLKSYLTAMHYMIAFNPSYKIITFWDEPTISMDRESDPLHELIQKNWQQNLIGNVVLSCATLPREYEILDTIADFRDRFDCTEVHTITSYDCKKSISVLSKDGYCTLPHTLFSDWRELQDCVAFCDENKSILRYFDLSEVVRFITYMTKWSDSVSERYHIENYFSGGIGDITMNRLKLFYLDLLRGIPEDSWTTFYLDLVKGAGFKFNKSPGIKSATAAAAPAAATATAPAAATAAGIQLTTEDAYTLTDGPTIFLTEDVNKIGQFYIQQTDIPKTVFQQILTTITQNSKISDKIDRLEKDLEDKDKRLSCGGGSGTRSGEEEKKGKAKEINMEKINPEVNKMYKEIDDLKSQISYISLESIYIPNSKAHQGKWISKELTKQIESTRPYMPMIGEQTVKDIMGLAIENSLKVLLLLGIGLFIETPNPRYLEIMKELADAQQLYLIIANSDYIYGTNYQFCHQFLSKDLVNMTQQKIIQAWGRVARGDIQHTYTVRVRDDALIMKAFQRPLENIEAQNMSRLFCS